MLSRISFQQYYASLRSSAWAWVLIAGVGCQTQKTLPPPPLAPVPEMLCPRPNMPSGSSIPSSQETSEPNSLPLGGRRLSPNTPQPSASVPRAAGEHRTEPADLASWRALDSNQGNSRPTNAAQTVALTEVQQRAQAVYLRLVRSQPQWRLPQRLVVTADARPYFDVRSTAELIVSAGLVQRCSSDSQLAGVLSLALADWMVKHAPKTASVALEPLDVRVGPESSTYGELPLLRQAELVKTGQAQRPNWWRNYGDSENIARQIYRRAGYSDAEFASARSLFLQFR